MFMSIVPYYRGLRNWGPEMESASLIPTENIIKGILLNALHGLVSLSLSTSFFFSNDHLVARLYLRNILFSREFFSRKALPPVHHAWTRPKKKKAFCNLFSDVSPPSWRTRNKDCASSILPWGTHGSDSVGYTEEPHSCALFKRVSRVPPALETRQGAFPKFVHLVCTSGARDEWST